LQGFRTSSPFLMSQLSFSAVTTISPSTASRGVLPESREDTLQQRDAHTGCHKGEEGGSGCRVWGQQQQRGSQGADTEHSASQPGLQCALQRCRHCHDCPHGSTPHQPTDTTHTTDNQSKRVQAASPPAKHLWTGVIKILPAHLQISCW
jgi:hypothetical protein